MENPFGRKDEESTEENKEVVVQEEKVEPTSLKDLNVTTELNKPNEPINEEPESLTEDDTKEVVKSAKQMTLEEYGGLESNVPVNSSYWNMK